MIVDRRGARVWARAQPTDLRKGYTGLAALVTQEMGHDLVTGDLFLFVSRTRTSLKILRWDGTGLCIYGKRLARGRFAAPWKRGQEGEVRLTQTELRQLLRGAEGAGRGHAQT